jgi:hypothetical protein
MESTTTSAAHPKAFRMTNVYPCMGALPKRDAYELRPGTSGRPREMICTMAIDGGAYREAIRRGEVDEEDEDKMEDFKACYCIGSAPTAPPTCHPANPTCGRYPYGKTPQVEHTLDNLEIMSLCTPYKPGSMVTNFDNKQAINNQPNALWQLLCGPINVPNANSPALVAAPNTTATPITGTTL